MYEEVAAGKVDRAYEEAKERYAAVGVDTDEALKKLAAVPISINCWQGDDVTGFEGAEGITGGGILATGNYGGKPRTPDELREDFDIAASLIPGTHRFNLHAIYLEHGGTPVERDSISIEHFQRWVDWAKERNLALDFNPTFFSHPKADEGWTLASEDKSIRDFWVEHGKRCREISAEMGKQLGSPCLDNFWMPDGAKDVTADRLSPRKRLAESLDKIFEPSFDQSHTLDAVESKLFGIGSESYVVGSHDFYVAYALSRNVMLTMDAGHYHPTESIADKIPALLPFMNNLMLHVSRPVRWDSDHVVILDDPTKEIAREIVSADALDRVYLAVDFFDASINRISAWVVGIRSTQRAVLSALLEPWRELRAHESKGRLGDRLALFEEAKSLPFGAVWDKYCQDNGVPVGPAWLNTVAEYEKRVLAKRN